MKNFKKVIILSIIIVVISIYLICNYTNNTIEDFTEEDIYVETDANSEKTDTIVIHITGEVYKPRNYSNRGGRKTR